MASEQTPLLTSSRDGTPHEAVYDRFTPDQKRWIVFLVSFAGLLPSKQSWMIHYRRTMLMNVRSEFVSTTFVPSIPRIAKDLNSTHANVRCVLYVNQM